MQRRAAPEPEACRLCAQHPECWLKKALAVKHVSVSLDAAAERPAVEQRGSQLPLLRAPDIEARVARARLRTLLRRARDCPSHGFHFV